MGSLRLLSRVALALITTSCGGGGDDDEPAGATATPPPDDCPAPNRWSSDGQCRAPGEQDDGCLAGTAAQDDGSCLLAGIPVEACLPGFAPSGDLCEPILPPGVCPEGEMAVMGETTCRPVMSCSTGTWGDLPVDGATTYVDQSYGGGDGDGSEQRPWTTITDGVTHAPAGGLVAVAAGSYAEDVVIAHKAVRLWGVCPSQVEIVGVGDYAALSLSSLNESAEVGGVAITGEGMGMIVVGAPEVLVDRVWIHHTARRGLDAEDALGPTTLIVRGSLIEEAQLLGLSVFGAEADLQDTVVRATVPPTSDDLLGMGVVAFPGADSGARSNLVLRNVLVELNHASGIVSSAADVTLEGTVVRDTQSGSAQTYGFGILATDSPQTNEPSVLTIRSSVVEGNRSVGVFVSASDAHLEATLVRNTDPEESTQYLGCGIVLESGESPAPSANLTVRSSVIEGSHTAGIFAFGGHQIDVESTVVRHTVPTASSGLCGRGIDVTASPNSASPPTVRLHGSRLEQNVDVNVFFGGANATVSGTFMHNGGQGLHLQAHEDLGMFATLVLSGSLLANNEPVGVGIYSAQAHIDGCHIDTTLPNAWGYYGDGLMVSSGEHAASLHLATSLVSNSLRAGLSNFGAFASVGDSALYCQGFDMDGEVYGGQQPTFENRGGNSCGCDGAEEECEAVSAGLLPPPPSDIAPVPPTN